ncbi:hypothetical protein OXX80_010445 [Metschnikowia pulcherrima]
MSKYNFSEVSELLGEKMVTIGISVSGGGYRSMLSGAGVLSAMDIRTPDSENHLGGILQSSTYIAGNSGGSWLVANNLLNDGLPVYEALRTQSFATPLIEGVPDVPVSQLRATLDAQSPRDYNASVWETYSVLFNQSDVEKGSLAHAFLDTFFKSKSQDNDQSIDTAPLGRKSLDFYKDLNIEVRAKKTAGFQVSLIDYWGRAVSKKIFPQGKKAIDLCLSTVVESPSFENFSQLFPIFGSVERMPGVTELSVDSHLFEFNPFEFGSWDSYLNSFVDINFLGSKLENGFSTIKTKNEDYSVCISGYDNMGLITGTSSGLFNTVFQYVYKMILQMEDSSSSLFSMLLRVFGITNHPTPDEILHPEYALYSPNPFKAISPPRAKGRSISDAPSLFLADGGDDGQNLPFHPMLTKGREVEVVLAFDATSDYENYPNGTTLKQTAKRYHASNSSLRIPAFSFNGKLKRIFPVIPSSEEFVSKSMASRPVFFGCNITRDYPSEILTDAKSIESPDTSMAPKLQPESKNIHPSLEELESKFDIWHDYQPPLIVYLANYNHSYASNTSTFRTVYSDTEVLKMLENGYNVATYNNNTEYLRCVGCALIQRRAAKSSKFANYLKQCKTCLEKFCYAASE